MSFLLFLVLTSIILVSVTLLDYVYNNGELFFISNKKELTQALITLSVPLVNIFVLIIIIQKHMTGNKNEQNRSDSSNDY
jgi:hypothetical protein